jgi:threonine dehydrogenase-like Zn-dependent dehydrogenase
MRGIRFAGNSQTELVELDMPVPGDNDVIVAIKCSGICGSDLIRFPKSAEAQGAMLDVVSGHEGAGVVSEVGSAVTDVKVGDRVVLYFKLGCGECEYCILGHTVHCKRLVSLGRDVTGSGADYVKIPSWAALPLPDDFSFADGAVLACNFGTAFAAIANSSLVRNGEVGFAHIYGAGPVGVCAALVAKAFGLTVTVSDLNSGRCEYAERTCDVVTVDASDPDAEQHLAALTNGRGFDLVIETTGSTPGRTSAILNAAPLGEVVLVGNGEARPLTPLGQVKDKQLHVRGSVIYRPQEYPAMVEICRKLPVKLADLAAAAYPLERAQEAFSRAMSRDGGKILLTRTEN